MLLGEPGLKLPTLSAEVVVTDLVSKDRDGRKAIEVIKQSGTKRHLEIKKERNSTDQNIPVLPKAYLAIKVEECNLMQRSEAMLEKQNKIENLEKLLKLMENNGEQETGEYVRQKSIYKKLLSGDSDENEIPIFSIDDADSNCDVSASTITL